MIIYGKFDRHVFGALSHACSREGLATRYLIKDIGLNYGFMPLARSGLDLPCIIARQGMRI